MAFARVNGVVLHHDVRGNAGSGDTCYGGGQAGDTFTACETIIP